MPLQHHPRRGAILICDYAGFKPPEMVKRRPVIVLSPRRRRRYNLCSIVPLSTTEPDIKQPYHCEIELDPPPPDRWASRCWVKADMITTVSFARLDLIRSGKDALGKRRYYDHVLPKEDMARISRCVLAALGIDSV